MSTNNNLNHISDLSKYKIFDPTGTQWDSTVTDVQSALGDIGSWATTTHGLPVASTTKAGIIAIATQDVVNAGTDNTTAITPATLAVQLLKPAATTTVAGISRYATDAEALAGSVTNASITAESLGYVFTNRKATETLSGSVLLTNNTQATAGTDTTTATTPQRVKQMIALFSPTQVSYQPASNSVLGVTYIATSQQTAAGTLDTGYAVSPKALMATTASATQFGVIRTANQNETAALTNPNIAVSPYTLGQLTATTNRAGIVKLASNFTSDSTLAAQASQTVFLSATINGHYLSAPLTLGPSDIGTYSTTDIDNRDSLVRSDLTNNINNVENYILNSLTSTGGVYSMAFLGNKSNTTFNPGDVTDGSNLIWASMAADWLYNGNAPGKKGSHDFAVLSASYSPQGSWKCMGFCPAQGSDYGYATLFIRVS